MSEQRNVLPASAIEIREAIAGLTDGDSDGFTTLQEALERLFADVADRLPVDDVLDQRLAGRRLARSSATATQAAITTNTDITALAPITFECRGPDYPVTVRFRLPWIFGGSGVGSVQTASITDAANTVKAYAVSSIPPIPSTQAFTTVEVEEVITVAGPYTRKGRLTSTASVTNNANLATIVSYIEAVEHAVPLA